MSNPLDNNPFATPDPEQVARNEALRKQQEQEQYAAQQQQWAQYQHWAAQQQTQAQQQAQAPQESAPPPYQTGRASHHWQGQNPTGAGTAQSGSTPAGYPPAPYPPPYTPPYIPPTGYAPPRTAGLAIAAMVIGIVSLFAAPLGLIALILGIIALRRIKRTHMGGRGMAIAGTVMGAVMTTVMIGFIVLIVALIPQAGVSVNVTKPQVISSHQATVGHCLDELPQTTTGELKYSLVPCRQAHVAEIIGRKSVTTMGEFPATEDEMEEALIKCLRNSVSTGSLERAGLENFEVFLVYPPEDVWYDDNALVDVHCMVRPVSGQMTGRVSDSYFELLP